MTCDSHILDVINSLLKATSDKDEKVRSAVYSSLKKITRKHLNDVLQATISYRRKHSKLTTQEVRCMIVMIKEICDENLQSLEEATVILVIEFAIEESLKCNDLPYTAADILTVLGTKYCAEIYERIMKYMENEVVPHGSVIYMIGNLAAANIQTFLPFSKACFDFLQSILPLIKTDNLKKLYAVAIHQLVEAIVEHISVDNSSVAKENYSPVVEEIFDIFTNTWLQTKDHKLCEAVVRALGSMILLYSSPKLMNDTNRILNTLLGLYKKPSTLPRYVITQGISNLLSVVPRAALQPCLDNLFHALHNLVWITPDFAQPLTVKNHSEVLRCYDYIGALFEEKLCEVILRHLRSTSEQDRVVALIVATHMLSSSEKILRPKISELVSILHTLLNETSVKINRSIVKIIVALAYREYFTEKEDVFIEFLIKHCYHNAASRELEDLESMCSNTVFLLNTTVNAVQHVCWKVLLHVLVTGKHNQAASILAKSLAYLVEKCDTSVLEKYSFERSELVFVRAVTLLGSPLYQSRGVHLLNFLHHYVLWKVKVDGPIWKHKVTQLIQYLENSTFSDQEWEGMLFDTFTAAFTDETKPWLKLVNTETLALLTERLNSSENAQNPYSNDNNITINERAMLYKMLAFFTQYIDQDEAAINANIEKILSPISFRSLLDLKACSRAIGILSRTNLSHILKHLELIQQTLLTRKTTKFLGLIKDSKSESDVETVRRMICECYSEMLMEAPPRLLLPKLKPLTVWYISQMQVAKDSQTKNSCLEALLCMSDIVLKYEDSYEDVEECRKTVLTFVIGVIDNEKSFPNVVALKIFITLFKLSANLPANEKLQILQKCLNKLFQYYVALSSNLSTTSTTIDCKSFDEDPVTQQLCLLIKEVVSVSSSMVEEIVTFLQPWLSHRMITLRIVSMFLLRSTLQCCMECFAADTEYSMKLSLTESLLGRMCVRTFEANKELNKVACECIILLLAIFDCVRNSEAIDHEHVRYCLTNADAFNAEVTLIANCQKFSSTQLWQIIENLINGLTDSEDSCSLGTARLMTVLFTEIRSQLNLQALEIFNNTLLKLVKVTNEEIQDECIKAMISLAKSHREMFIVTMLKQSLPLHNVITKCWQRVAEDQEFVDEVLVSLLEVITKVDGIYDEESSQSKRKHLAARPIVAIYTVKEILTYTVHCILEKNRFVDLFSCFLMLIPMYKGEAFHCVDTRDTSSKIGKDSSTYIFPSKLVFDTLVVIMKRNPKCGADMEEGLKQLSTETDFKKSGSSSSMIEMIKIFARSVCQFHREEVSAILIGMLNYAAKQSNYELSRITIAVFYAEVLNEKCNNDPVLVENVINLLLDYLSDSSPLIRENCLKGLALLSDLEGSVVEQHKTRVLSALMKGLDDDQAAVQHGIILQSLLGLSKLLSSLKNDYPASLFISIALGMKPFFEKENSDIRRLSLELFGKLAYCVMEKSDDLSAFSEQALNNLLCLLFHLGEKENAVSEACKYSLKATTLLLHSKNLSSVIDEYLIDDAKFNYEKFVKKFAKVLVREFPDRCADFVMTSISYSKSARSEIRAVATMFIGILCGQNLSKEHSEKLPLDSVTSKLLILLKDKDPVIRANAAISLSQVIQPASFTSSDSES